MSSDIRKELESQGFLLIRKLHLFLVLATFVIGGIAQVTLAFRAIEDHEEGISNHEERIQRLEDEDFNKRDVLNEIKLNLKIYFESQGINYVENK